MKWSFRWLSKFDAPEAVGVNLSRGDEDSFAEQFADLMAERTHGYTSFN